MLLSGAVWLLSALGIASALAATGAFLYGVVRLWMLAARDAKDDKALSRSDARFAAYARVGTPEYLKYVKMAGLAWLTGVLAAVLLFVVRARA